MTDLLVGLDLGTTSIKACVIDVAGVELAHGSAPTPWRTLATGAETTLPAVTDAATVALSAALERAPRGRSLGIGVTGMAESGVLLDRHGEPVTELIAWHDTRGGDHVEGFAREVGHDRFRSMTGLPISPTPSIAKLAWLDAVDDRLSRATRWLGVPEAVAKWLGAAPVADLSLSCRTGMLELPGRRWWDEATDWLGIPEGLLAEVTPSGTAVGRVTRSHLPPPLGELLDNAVITVAGHDHLTAALGAGATDHDQVFDSCGTAEALIASSAPLTPDRVLAAVQSDLSVSWHVLPQRQALIAALPTGRFLGDVRDRLGEAGSDLAEIEAAAANADPGLLVATDETGLLSPDAIAAGADPGVVWSSAVTHAAALANDRLDVMRRHGASAAAAVCTGGWIRSSALVAAKRALGPITISPVVEAAGRGAALAAGVATGLYSSPLDVPAPPPTADSSNPPTEENP